MGNPWDININITIYLEKHHTLFQNPWEIRGKSVGNPWEIHGKWMKQHGNHMEKLGGKKL